MDVAAEAAPAPRSSPSADARLARDAETHYQIGLIYLERRLYDKAVARFEKALEVNPNHQRARQKLVESIRKQQESERRGLLTFGRLSVSLGQYDEARKHYQTALEKYPEDIEFRDALLAVPSREFVGFRWLPTIPWWFATALTLLLLVAVIRHVVVAGGSGRRVWVSPFEGAEGPDETSRKALGRALADLTIEQLQASRYTAGRSGVYETATERLASLSAGLAGARGQFFAEAIRWLFSPIGLRLEAFLGRPTTTKPLTGVPRLTRLDSLRRERLLTTDTLVLPPGIPAEYEYPVGAQLVGAWVVYMTEVRGLGGA